MNRPSLGTRVAGSPQGALLIVAGCAVLIISWYQDGGVPWWLAVGAGAEIFRVFGAVGRMRRYNAWLKEWRAMAGEEAPAPKKRKWIRDIGVTLLGIAIPAGLRYMRGGQERSDEIPITLVALFALWFAWMVLGRFRRRMAHSEARRREKAEIAPVAWLLRVPSSSPSRAEAQANLPEYCAQLLAPTGGARREP